jgi:hypothetical protein
LHLAVISFSMQVSKRQQQIAQPWPRNFPPSSPDSLLTVTFSTGDLQQAPPAALTIVLPLTCCPDPRSRSCAAPESGTTCAVNVTISPGKMLKVTDEQTPRSRSKTVAADSEHPKSYGAWGRWDGWGYKTLARLHPFCLPLAVIKRATCVSERVFPAENTPAERRDDVYMSSLPAQRRQQGHLPQGRVL